MVLSVEDMLRLKQHVLSVEDLGLNEHSRRILAYSFF